MNEKELAAKIAKLPAWARSYIGQLESERNGEAFLREQATQHMNLAYPVSRVYLKEYARPNRYLPDDVAITLDPLGDPRLGPIDVRVVQYSQSLPENEGWIEVAAGWNPLEITPVASNVIGVRVRKR